MIWIIAAVLIWNLILTIRMLNQEKALKRIIEECKKYIGVMSTASESTTTWDSVAKRRDG